jgi:hypothetical protein
MTLQERIMTDLVQQGLWPKEAEAVMAELKSDKTIEGLATVRWNDDQYPDHLVATVWAIAKHKAVEWIDRNEPMHFARHFLTQP